MNIKYLCKYQLLEDMTLRKHKDEIDWDVVCKFNPLFETTMTKYAHLLNWYLVSRYQRLTTDFICDHQEKVDWELVCKYQRLDIAILSARIHEVNERISWRYLCKYQQITDAFLYKCINTHNPMFWRAVSQYAIMSVQFIREHSCLVDWDMIKYNKRIRFNRDEKIEFIDYLLPDNHKWE